MRLRVPPEPSRSYKPAVCEPSPVTVKLPVVPLRIMPLVALFEPPLLTVMLRNVTPLPPMFVGVAMLTAVPVVVVMVLSIVALFCVALTVPPPVAVNAALVAVVRLRPPVKLIVAPVLLLSRMPVPVSEIAPVTSTVPPVRF